MLGKAQALRPGVEEGCGRRELDFGVVSSGNDQAPGSFCVLRDLKDLPPATPVKCFLEFFFNAPPKERIRSAPSDMQPSFKHYCLT